LNGTFSSGSTQPGTHYALAVGAGDPFVDVKDNELHKSVVYTGASPNVGSCYAIGTASTDFVNLTSDFNDLFTAAGAAYFVGRTASLTQAAGSSHVALLDWQTATGGDAASLSADPTFNSPTNLQPYPGSPLVGAGTPVGVGIDITGAGRSGTNPTIGAWENAGDSAGPVITYTAFGHITTTGNRVLAITATDFSGVPLAGSGRPAIWFRKGTSDPFVFTTCVHTGGDGYDCTIDYSLVTGGAVAPGDTVEYYVAAQDTLGNVATNPAPGADLFGTDPPAAGVAPTPPNSYLIAIVFTGTYSVGTGEPAPFDSLTNPGGVFFHINNGFLSADLTLEISTDLTGETGAVALNQWAEQGAGGYTLTIKPSAAPALPRIIAGPSSAAAMIILNGTDRVTIDGSASGGTDRSLVLSNTSTAAQSAVVWIRSAGASNGANDNTVKNCRISGNSGTTTLHGILAGGTGFGSPAEAQNSNNTVQNNEITRVQNGIVVSGHSATRDQNWLISENTLGSTLAGEKLGLRGLQLGNAEGFSVADNTVLGVVTASSSFSTVSGIQVMSGILNGSILRNRVSDIKQTHPSGFGANGIWLNSSTTSANLTVSNNFIWDVAGQGSTGVGTNNNGWGILASTGGGYRIHHNSVNMNTNQVAAASITAAINVTSTVTTVGAIDLRNNVLSNAETVGTRYAIYSGAAASAYSPINHNDYFAQNVGFLGVARPTLANWQTATAQDANSIAVNPAFVSPTDLHIDIAGGPSPVENAGATLAGVTDDIDGDARFTLPEIGADEVDACATAACVDTVCAFLTCAPAGLSGNCDTAAPKPLGTPCRAAMDVCDAAEVCDGSSTTCPVDGFQPSTTECNPSVGDCDAAEFCTGGSAACPPDVLEPAATVCRMAAGDCDAVETCTGADVDCPADLLAPASTTCRPSEGDCDIAESCSGVDVDCPADELVAADTECRPGAGDCDVAESCSGVDAACPDDEFVPENTECRESAGDCDVAEYCTGSGAVCPSNAFEPSTTECRPSTGAVCDPGEFCTGSTADCPPDAFGQNAAIGYTMQAAKSGASATISWTDEVEPGPFNVYRGSKRQGDPWDYNQGCVLANSASESVTDPAVPDPTMAYYYLVTRVRPPCSESSLGTDSSLVERPNDNPCPSPGDDTDSDGLMDYDDNCYTVFNPLQNDTDNDSYGDVCDNCPTVSNRTQVDTDDDGFGDACDTNQP
jgi:hypothetical protein